MKKWIFVLLLILYTVTSYAKDRESHSMIDKHSIRFVDTHFKSKNMYSPAISKRTYGWIDTLVYDQKPNSEELNSVLNTLLSCNVIDDNQQLLINSHSTESAILTDSYVYEIILPNTNQQIDSVSSRQSQLQAEQNLLLSKRTVILIAIGALLIALLQVYFCWQQTHITRL